MISIIIPTLNEAKALPATLTAIVRQQQDVEIIIADGGSHDATLDCLKKYKAVKVVEAKAGRASQMNAGAAIAEGDWLLFLHADALLPDNALTIIAKQQADAGGFKHKFSGSAWGLKVVSWLHNYRCRLTGVFYGDQAMFIRKSLFIEIGGFPEVSILEDLLFGEKLRNYTTPVFLDEEVVSDSRKFEQQGIWLSLLRVIQIQICHEFNLPNMNRKFFANVR